MVIRTRQHQIAVKIESAAGVDPWSGGEPATNEVINAFDPDVQDSPEFIDRSTAGASLSKGPSTVSKNQRTFTFRTDMVGNTTGGTDDEKRNAVPPYEPLARASGFKVGSLTRVTGTVSSGPFYPGERVGGSAWSGGEPTNWGIAMTDGIGHLIICPIKGTLGSETAFHGEESLASITTPTIDVTGGRFARPESGAEITVDLTVAGWTGTPPSVGDVVLVKRSGEQVGAAIVLEVADPIRLNLYYGSIQPADVLETAGGDTAVVEAGTPVTLLQGATAALYSNRGGKAQKALGCRGDWSLQGDAGSQLEFSWTMRGSAENPYDAPLLAGLSLSPLQGPRFIGATLAIGYDRTGSGGYFSTKIPIKSIQVAPAGTVTERRDGCAASGIIGAEITDRDPEIQIELEDVGVLAFDWDRLVRTGERVRFGMFFGTSVGNILSIACNWGQTVARVNGDSDGIATNQVTIKCRRIQEAGDDELVIGKF